MKVGERYIGYGTIVEIVALPGKWGSLLQEKSSYIRDGFPLCRSVKDFPSTNWSLGKLSGATISGSHFWVLLKNQTKEIK